MEQIDFFRYTIQQLELLSIQYMLVGSYASGIHGESRQTRDIDIVLEMQTSQVDMFCASFRAPTYYVSPQAVLEAIRKRFQFNVVCNYTGDKVDFIFPRSDEWGLSQLSRRQRIKITPTLYSYVASPADVIVGKLWYFSEGSSEKHIRDIVSIMKTSQELFDFDDVGRWASKLGYQSVWERCLNEYRLSKSEKGT
ncbi:MAG: hypothetical protein U0798_01480 [Gemmataceae bacterium]